LDRELVELQLEYRTANHVVAAGDTPAGCDEETVGWWRDAFAVVQQRRWDIDVAVTRQASDAPSTELCKDRLRKPAR